MNAEDTVPVIPMSDDGGQEGKAEEEREKSKQPQSGNT